LVLEGGCEPASQHTCGCGRKEKQTWLFVPTSENELGLACCRLEGWGLRQGTAVCTPQFPCRWWERVCWCGRSAPPFFRPGSARGHQLEGDPVVEVPEPRPDEAGTEVGAAAGKEVVRADVDTVSEEKGSEQGVFVPREGQRGWGGSGEQV